MSGGIASYQDGLVKPGKDIFRLFLSRYEKRAEECVFVDDTPINTEAASAVGFNTIILKNIDDLSFELCRFPELKKVIDS